MSEYDWMELEHLSGNLHGMAAETYNVLSKILSRLDEYDQMEIQRRLQRLESQQSVSSVETPQSPEPLVTTASPTTGGGWDAEGSILRTTVESWLLARATTESLVGLVFKYAGLRGALPDDAQILALAAQARKLTSAKPASAPSVETSTKAAATSPSESSEQCEARGTIGRWDGLRCSRESGHKGSHWTHDGIMFPSVPGSEE